MQISTQQRDLLNLMKELDEVKAKQKSLSTIENKLKTEALDLMKEIGIDKEETPYGNVSIRTRIEKDYGPEVRKLEKELKATKKMLDDMGQFEVMSVKESVYFTPVKEFF